MAGVFQIIDPPPPSAPGEYVLGAGEDTLAGWRGGWGVDILEDVRHISVLYACKYFVGLHQAFAKQAYKYITSACAYTGRSEL
jgi:hypothetical protein